MMGTGQLNIALGVGQELMSQPLLQDRQRDPPEDAVAEGVGSGWVYPGSCRRSLHALPDPLAGDVKHGPAAVLGVIRGQLGQAPPAGPRRLGASETLSPVLSMILKAMRVG